METAKSRLATKVESGSVAHCQMRPNERWISFDHPAAIAVAEGRGGERPPNGAADEQI